MGYRAKINELVNRLQLELPIEVTLEDPISGQPFTVKRANVLQLLMFNPEALVVEMQTVAPLYAEMARLQRAAEFKRDRVETSFTRWKAKTAIEARRTRDPETGKYPSEDKAKDLYRSKKEYRERAEEVARYNAMAGLFEDLKWAFNKKSAHLESMQKSIGGYESTERASATDGSPEDSDRLEELAGAIFTANAGELEQEMDGYWPDGQKKEVEEEGDDEEDDELEEVEEAEEEDEDEDEELATPPPPPPGPKKKSRKKKKRSSKKARTQTRRG